MIETIVMSRQQARNDSEIAVSRYLDYLPSVYRDNEFIGRFLLIFESELGPIENMVDSKGHSKAQTKKLISCVSRYSNELYKNYTINITGL